MIMLLLKSICALKFRVRNENPLTGGEKVNTSEPYVMPGSRLVTYTVAKYKNTPFNLRTGLPMGLSQYVRVK